MMSTNQGAEEAPSQFCGWKINHKEHSGTDIVDGSELFICPGYEWINNHA